MEAGERTDEADEDAMLIALSHRRNASVAQLAKACRFVGDDGSVLKSKAFRVLRRLADDRLVVMVRGKYRLTEKGRGEVAGSEI